MSPAMAVRLETDYGDSGDIAKNMKRYKTASVAALFSIFLAFWKAVERGFDI